MANLKFHRTSMTKQTQFFDLHISPAVYKNDRTEILLRVQSDGYLRFLTHTHFQESCTVWRSKIKKNFPYAWVLSLPEYKSEKESRREVRYLRTIFLKGNSL